LNIAEIELNVLGGQCLKRRIDEIEKVSREVQAWQEDRNAKDTSVDWRFTTKDARIKLKQLYPKL
ncbi:MAG: IS630 family transposase, partial [Balneolaceae bacterium]|nr:IS630 family transposase [Balneolaceae bacterium]